MSRVHGRNTVVILDGIDISTHCNTSTETLGADVHDLTTYGKTEHVNAGGLGTSAASLGGWYDSSLTNGPRAILVARRGQTVPFTKRPEGTGTGKPQSRFSVVVGQYVETDPVADYIAWTCQLTGSDTVDTTPQ